MQNAHEVLAGVGGESGDVGEHAAGISGLEPALHLYHGPQRTAFLHRDGAHPRVRAEDGAVGGRQLHEPRRARVGDLFIRGERAVAVGVDPYSCGEARRPAVQQHLERSRMQRYLGAVFGEPERRARPVFPADHVMSEFQPILGAVRARHIGLKVDQQPLDAAVRPFCEHGGLQRDLRSRSVQQPRIPGGRERALRERNARRHRPPPPLYRRLVGDLEGHGITCHVTPRPASRSGRERKVLRRHLGTVRRSSQQAIVIGPVRLQVVQDDTMVVVD